jgi:hypothetical protein
MLVDEIDAFKDYRARNEALFEGAEAGRQLLPGSLNPYSPETEDHAQWLKGWRSGTARRLAAILREQAKRVPCDPCTCGGVGLCRDVG